MMQDGGTVQSKLSVARIAAQPEAGMDFYVCTRRFPPCGCMNVVGALVRLFLRDGEYVEECFLCEATWTKYDLQQSKWVESFR